MRHFTYRAGVMHAEDVALPALAGAVGTPFYCYSTATLTRHYRVFAEAFVGRDALVCYAMKANSNQAVVKTLAGLGAAILCFNVESEPEMEALSEVALSKGTQAPISIRVNPDVDAKTHRKISTGRSENKFGIPISRAREIYAHAASLDGLTVTGVDMHIGSQITDLEPFDN